MAVPPGHRILPGNGAYYLNGVQVKEYASGTVGIFTTASTAWRKACLSSRCLATFREVITHTFGDKGDVEKIMDIVDDKRYRRDEIPLVEFSPGTAGTCWCVTMAPARWSSSTRREGCSSKEGSG